MRNELGRFGKNDYTGEKYGMLTPIRDIGKMSKKGCHIWECRCDCGKTIEVESQRIKRLNNCGCQKKTSYRTNCDERMIDGEKWKIIDGYDNYEVSNKGRIKSKNYLGKGLVRELKPSHDNKGYLRISLSKNGDRKTHKIHRIVATMFIENPFNYREVNHINGIKDDNRVENLEWVTPSQNVKKAYDSGLKEKNRMFANELGKKYSKNLEKYRDYRKVRVTSIEIKTGEKREFESISEAARKCNTNESNVWNVLNGKRKQAKGYMFVKGGDADAY